MPKANLPGPLEGPHGESEEKKDVKTGSTSGQKNNLALEKGRIKHSK